MHPEGPRGSQRWRVLTVRCLLVDRKFARMARGRAGMALRAAMEEHASEEQPPEVEHVSGPSTCRVCRPLGALS